MSMITCQYATRVGGLELQEAFRKPEPALQYLREQATDLLFLDIELQGMNGFDLLQQLPYKPAVVMLSAHTQYAHLAYEYQAFDFLKKPFTFERFREMKDKFDLMYEQPHLEFPHEEIFVRTDREFKKLPFGAICYIQVIDKYLKIVTDSGSLLINGALQQIERKLCRRLFFRTHRSYLVNVRKIDSLTDNMVLVKGQAIPLSKTQRLLLGNRINIL
ncbi:hypothetical protein BUE76_02080 [Cnuella takakiae]|nr:hypothetical protein BUE76_02080 [Cnuella takakiae]